MTTFTCSKYFFVAQIKSYVMKERAQHH